MTDAMVVAAEEVQLQPFAGFPRRWEMVGFELADDDDAASKATPKTAVKRIVGLPGETIEIRDGNLYSRGNVLRKSWALQKQIRVPVFDSKFDAIAPFGNSQRFRPASDESGWQVNESVLRMTSPTGEIDWLDYVHWRNCKRKGPRDEAFPICDSYGFNQKTVRELNPTDDLMIELDAEFDVDSTLNFAYRRGKAEYFFEISKTEKEFLFSWQGETKRKPLVYRSLVPEELPRGLIEFSSFDHALMLRINGVAVFEIREDEDGSVDAAESQFPADEASVFRIGGSQGSFRINRTRIWRDLYYLTAAAQFESPETLELTAGSEEYLVLGDNSPKSLDSRNWKSPGIPLSKLIGRLKPIPSSR